jgi:hypothetical protein
MLGRGGPCATVCIHAGLLPKALQELLQHGDEEVINTPPMSGAPLPPLPGSAHPVHARHRDVGAGAELSGRASPTAISDANISAINTAVRQVLSNILST